MESMWALHRLVREVVAASDAEREERDEREDDTGDNGDGVADARPAGKRLDGALVALAMGLGMPGLPAGVEGTTSARVLAMQYIATVVQCGVMMMRAKEAREVREAGSGGGDSRVVQKGVRRLWVAARRLRAAGERGREIEDETEMEMERERGSEMLPSISEGLTTVNPVPSLADVCVEVDEAVKGSIPALPDGFFDVMVPTSFSGLDPGQREKLVLVAGALERETGLRRKMMVDRAMSTLKTFGIRQDPAKIKVLDGLTEDARVRMASVGRTWENMDSSAQTHPPEGGLGLNEAFRMVRGEVVSLLVERGVGEMHGEANNKVKTVQIGHVPDRGGRPEGVSRQAALMPEWKARENTKADGGKGKGGGGNLKSKNAKKKQKT